MPIEILMPALSPTMEEGNLAKWLVREGEKVVAGDIIAEIETDKATMEVETIDEGTIARLVVAEGSQGVRVNELIAILAEEGEDAEALASYGSSDDSSIRDRQDSEGQVEKNQSVSLTDFPEAADVRVKSEGRAEEALMNPEMDMDTEMTSMTVRQALCDAMVEEMRMDDSVFVMGEEVAEYEGAYKVTQGLLKEFGSRRVVDTPITEHGFTGLGVGAAMGGLKPIVEFMTFNFAMQAMDQLINSAARTLYMSGGQMNVPVVFRGPNGAAARVAAQHSQCFAVWFGHIPGLKVIAPYCASDAKGLLKAAIRDPNPVMFLENEILYGHTFDVPDQEDFVLPIGKARIHRSGNDVTIVSFGIGMTYVVEATEQMAEEGIDCEVIDLRTIRPLDMETILQSVRKTGRLVTVEEGFPQSSIGGHIASQIMQQAFDWLDAPVITICGKDVPMPYAANLEKLALPCVQEVIDAIKAVSYRN